MGRRILIVDDDPWICRMVGTALVRKGHTTEHARDGNEALQKALTFRPDLVITDVLMEGMDGWTLVRSLRARAELSMVPVIFLTALNSEDDRILGFRLGADDYLAKPFRFEELELRIERVLRTAAHARRRISEELASVSTVGLKGDLTHLGLSALLTLLEMERKSGILSIKTKPAGRVFLRRGKVLAAFVEGDKPLRGADAVYKMLTWTSGPFEFSALDVDMDDQIETSTTHLLMEGARRIDEGD